MWLTDNIALAYFRENNKYLIDKDKKTDKIKIYLTPIDRAPDFSHALSNLVRWRNDDRVRYNLRDVFDNTISGQEDWIKHVTKDKTCIYYFIWDAIENKAVGYCGLDKIHIANRTAEISLLVDPDRHGRGIGKEAVNKLLWVAFKRFNLNLVYAETYFNSEFWEKVGFTKEAELRDRKYYDNKYHNSTILSITQEEYYSRNITDD